jgi:hypothetical protein
VQDNNYKASQPFSFEISKPAFTIPSTTYPLAKYSELLQGTEDGRLPEFSFLRISDKTYKRPRSRKKGYIWIATSHHTKNI